MWDISLYLYKQESYAIVMAGQEYDQGQLVHHMFTTLVTFSCVVLISHTVGGLNVGTDNNKLNS